MAVSESGTYPSQFAQSRGCTLFHWNIKEEQVTDPMTGEVQTKYIYDEVAITGKATKAKILAAMRIAAREEDDGDIGEVAVQYENAKKKLKVTKVKKLNVPELGEAVSLLLDFLGIEYDTTS